ncbi:hypothetical protein CN345_27205, partial [Bacillus thuringiensis]
MIFKQIFLTIMCCTLTWMPLQMGISVQKKQPISSLKKDMTPATPSLITPFYITSFSTIFQNSQEPYKSSATKIP